METNKIWSAAPTRDFERERQRVFCQRLYIPHVNFVFSMKPVGRAAENEARRRRAAKNATTS